MLTTQKTTNQWVNEFKDLIRGASGGFLFGIPLLYTMEVWWIGSYATMPRLLLAMLITFTIVFMLNRTAGFRTADNIHPMDAAMESIEAIAIGTICAAVSLILIREITLETPISEALGKLVYESVPFTVGVALANQFLGHQGQETESSDRPQKSSSQSKSQKQKSSQSTIHATLADIGGTLLGALIIAFNIAPTDEVPMLVSAIQDLWLLALLVASLVVSYAIVFVAGFTNQQKRLQQDGIFQRPSSETLMSYLVSLAAAFVMLVFFDKVQWNDPWQIWLSHCIVLGFPATIGGAAGRLAI